MQRYFSVIAISSASFILGTQFSDRFRDGFGFMREGHAETMVVTREPAIIDVIGDKPTIAEIWKQPSRSAEIMKYGYPGYDNLRTFSDFVVSYDRRTRNPHWVQEHLTPECLVYDPEINRQKCQFKPDETIHPFFQSQNEDYRGSGYDRGHLAAAGNHRRSQLAMEQTFYLTNMSPQVGKGFNRDKWNDLEIHVRKSAKHALNTYIVSGPLYLPKKEADGHSYVRYKVIGKNTVAVPTHFFKVALIEKEKDKFELESYVLPNEVIPNEKPISDFFVPLDAIERSAGLLIFERMPKGKIVKINGQKTGGFSLF